MPTPTQRELEILQILWRNGQATVREVYEELRESLPIVQNTVQAFLRTMEEKGLVAHRKEGRTFVYRPLVEREGTNSKLASQLLKKVFDGALDQLVQSVFTVRQPTADELENLEQLIQQQKEKMDKAEGPQPKAN